MRVFFALFSTARRTVMLLALLTSLALNVATVTSTVVFTAVSGAVSAVTGASTVLARATTQRQVQRQAVKRTTRKVTARAARSAARNTASAAAEAIPFAGAAIIAAALAMEVKDACDTARDMTVLEGLVDDPDADPDALAAAFDCTVLIPESGDLPDVSALWAMVRAAPRAAWDAARDLYDSDLIPEAPRLPMAWPFGAGAPPAGPSLPDAPEAAPGSLWVPQTTGPEATEPAATGDAGLAGWIARMPDLGTLWGPDATAPGRVGGDTAPGTGTGSLGSLHVPQTGAGDRSDPVLPAPDLPER